MFATCVAERGRRNTCLFAKSRAETDAFTAAHYTVAAVIPSIQHPSTHAGAESIQLIYSGRALRALRTISLGNFGVTQFLGGTRMSNRKMLAGLIPVQ